jgi:hypothetical protein
LSSVKVFQYAQVTPIPALPSVLPLYKPMMGGFSAAKKVSITVFLAENAAKTA